jgi:HK97 gp10 family phage protein
VTVILKGKNEFIRAMRTDREKALIAARNIVEKGGLKLASSAKRNFRPRPGGQMTAQTSGKIYYSFAAPFQAIPPQPTSRSGALQGSLKILAITPTLDGWMSKTGSKLSYAGYVEYGTRFMAKEPYMEKALHDNEMKIRDLAEEEWAKAMGL